MKQQSALSASLMSSGQNDRFKVFKADDVYDLPDDDTALIPQEVASMVADRTRMELEEFNNSSSILSMSAAYQNHKRNGSSGSGNDADGITGTGSSAPHSLDIAPFHKHEIVLGDRLGRGCFSEIYAVKSFLPAPRSRYRRQVSAPARTPSTCASSTSSILTTIDQKEANAHHDGGGVQVTPGGDQQAEVEENSEEFEAVERTRKMMAQHTNYSSDSNLFPIHHSNNISDNIKRAAVTNNTCKSSNLDMAMSDHSRGACSTRSAGSSGSTCCDATPEYVVKHLRPSLTQSGDHELFETAAIDLGKEAQLLARIQHPNIIKIRGWSALGTSGYATGRHDGYFLILDRLYETLEERITYWQKKTNRLKMFLRSAKTERKALKVERLKIGVDIASALAYLHEHNLIYRDLKPKNLGFDIHGNIQLFDFGLAKEIPDMKGGYQDTYELSGCTGSMRYMAPEVARFEPYNLKADVYSFSILLYEILALVKPFANFNPETMNQKVFHEHGVRPKLNPSSWPAGITNILQECMCYDIALRPTMGEVHEVLSQQHKEMLNSISAGTGNSLTWSSTHSRCSSQDGSVEDPPLTRNALAQHQNAQDQGRHGKQRHVRRSSLSDATQMILPGSSTTCSASASSSGSNNNTSKRPSIASAALRNLLPVKSNSRSQSVRQLYNTISKASSRDEAKQSPKRNTFRTGRGKDLVRRDSCQF